MAQVTIGKSLPMLFLSLAVAAAMPQSADRSARPAVASGAQSTAPHAAVAASAIEGDASDGGGGASEPGGDSAYDGASRDAAESSDAERTAPPPRLDPQHLADLVAPIALYPDDLIAIILPASTFPLQVVEAQRFLEREKQEPEVTPDKSWDDSIVALLNYPDVLSMMDRDLDWTSDLGQAVAIDQGQVLDAIEQFRSRARVAGNLNSDDHQVVEEDRGAISIRSAEPDRIYVPYYEPAQVTVYQTEPVVFYYPVAFPVYYYPYPRNYPFGWPYFWGVSSAYRIGWWGYPCVHVYPYYNAGHPYYGRPYQGHYYRPPPSYRGDDGDWQQGAWPQNTVLPPPQHDAMPAAQALERVDDTVWRPAKVQRTSAQLGRGTHALQNGNRPEHDHGAGASGGNENMGEQRTSHPTWIRSDDGSEREREAPERDGATRAYAPSHSHIGNEGASPRANDDGAGSEAEVERRSERSATPPQAAPTIHREVEPQQPHAARSEPAPHPNDAHPQEPRERAQKQQQSGGSRPAHPPPANGSAPRQEAPSNEHQ